MMLPNPRGTLNWMGANVTDNIAAPLRDRVKTYCEKYRNPNCRSSSSPNSTT